jgi:hypothetical protein
LVAEFADELTEWTTVVLPLKLERQAKYIVPLPLVSEAADSSHSSMEPVAVEEIQKSQKEQKPPAEQLMPTCFIH